ncbi:flagellar biosynthesis protein FlhF [Azospirillum lipoferum]|uniref:Flagellar biosynthesis protein FlhF n=1 Tax=Azospirillum lipoferum TaxID=193 RepID=A0A5A9GD45_AZOLI|nr:MULTISPECIES: GTPase [Azospirillum]KAA0592383.1 GTPase [Azospirillum lipoferum]MCP1614581.1 flagellar biosynthesis protein FlhF [Azospirillum lipoferum]MDW5532588.1 GTPase [Azospirillum sp. NL1]
MRLKSFHAKTMSDAMRMVRQSLGDDAIIVATREEEGGGVRVTAAVEEDDLPPAPSSGGSRGGRGSKAPPKPVEPEIDVGEVVADALQRHGVPAALAEQLIDAASGLDTEDPRLALGSALDSFFTFNPLPDGRAPVKPLALVGPPGSGKTLVAAKLAARAVFKKCSVGVITTDTVRAGGVDQLAAFTRLMKLKLATVEDPDALAGAFEVHRRTDLVLVDTAGRNPFDADDMQDLRAMLSAGEVEPVLVLPAGLDAMEAADMALAFKAVGVRRMLVTRLDMTRRLGSVLAIAARARLSFCDASISSKVAEGLTALNPLALARMMIPAEEKAAAAKESAPRRTARTADWGEDDGDADNGQPDHTPERKPSFGRGYEPEEDEPGIEPAPPPRRAAAAAAKPTKPATAKPATKAKAASSPSSRTLP